ncbi:MAG TPA: hypothetical protein VF791_07325 [Pyrinomonadaceae bacterium]
MLRRILLTVIGFVLAGTLFAAETRAQFKGGADLREPGMNTAGVFQKVFGRDPTAAEKAEWASLANDEAVLESNLKTLLKQPKGAEELRLVIDRAYNRSFGRASTAKNMAYWQARIKNEILGYADLMNASREWLKKNATERQETIQRAYLWALGRDPLPGDMDYWSQEVQAKGTNYVEIRDACVNYMLGSKKDQIEELRGVILRAHAAANLPAPKDSEIKKWMVEVSAKKFTYHRLVKELKGN